MKKTGEILRVENLTKIYGEGENAVRALDGVSFSVQKGEFVAVMGASGSGKSTLLHLLGGVDRPTAGKVYVGGVDVYAQKEEELAVFRRRKVGLIYQFYNLIPVLTVEEEAPAAVSGHRTIELPAKQAPARKNSFRLEVEDVEEEDDEPEDDVILSRFSGKVGRLMARREQEDDFDDEDDEEEPPITSGKTIFSTKFGEMRFGEGFSLTEDEKGSSGRSERRGRR